MSRIFERTAFKELENKIVTDKTQIQKSTYQKSCIRSLNNELVKKQQINRNSWYRARVST